MVTIKDVAKEVGVAPSTVSRVLKDNPSISKETKEKVRTAMKKLGYVPNIAAQNLVTGLTNAIGVVFPPNESSDRKVEPFFMEILTSINQEAMNQNQTIAIATGITTDELLENVRLMHQQKRVDGFILLYTRKKDVVREYLTTNQVPYVLIGTPEENVNETSYVDNDNLSLGRDATEYLLSKGHENIFFVTDNLKDKVVYDRYFGYQKSLRKKGLMPYPIIELSREDPFGIASFPEKICEEKVTGVIVIGDILALRVLQLLQLNNINVPDDVSILSFNDSIFASLIHPYFTSFDIHVHELGKVALQRLCNEIQEGNETFHAKIIISHTLKESESVLDRNKIM